MHASISQHTHQSNSTKVQSGYVSDDLFTIACGVSNTLVWERNGVLSAEGKRGALSGKDRRSMDASRPMADGQRLALLMQRLSRDAALLAGFIMSMTFPLPPKTRETPFLASYVTALHRHHHTSLTVPNDPLSPRTGHCTRPSHLCGQPTSRWYGSLGRSSLAVRSLSPESSLRHPPSRTAHSAPTPTPTPISNPLHLRTLDPRSCHTPPDRVRVTRETFCCCYE